MFEPTWTWPRFTFYQLFIWIGPNNDQIWFRMDQMSDYEQCSNRLKLYLISHLVNFLGELGQIITRFDFLWTKQVILSNVRTDSQLDLISLLVNFSCELEQRMTFFFILNSSSLIRRTMRPSPHVDCLSLHFTLSHSLEGILLWSLHLSLSRSLEGLLYEAMLVYTPAALWGLIIYL